MRQLKKLVQTLLHPKDKKRNVQDHFLGTVRAPPAMERTPVQNRPRCVDPPFRPPKDDLRSNREFSDCEAHNPRPRQKAYLRDNSSFEAALRAPDDPSQQNLQRGERRLGRLRINY